MSILTFKGGVHPYDGKELSKDVAVRKVNPGKEVVIPVSQHIGAPAVPVIEIGDRVLKGQLIAKANGFVSANIHSSVSGTVKKIEPRLVPNGSKVLSIIIENDEQYEEMEYVFQHMLSLHRKMKMPLIILLLMERNVSHILHLITED